MKTLHEKLFEIIEVKLKEFSKIEPILINRIKGAQDVQVLIAVQRTESFSTLFTISLTIEPRAARVTFTPLIEAIDKTETITEGQKQVDTFTVDFKTNTGIQDIHNAINKRLLRSNINE